jgi:hypothetical protein
VDVAGKMKTDGPTVVEQWHPSWCDRGRCTAANAGTHESAPAVVGVDQVEADVYLSQRPWAAGLPDPVPLVHLEFRDRDDGEPHAVILPLNRARALAWVLRSTARLADL